MSRGRAGALALELRQVGADVGGVDARAPVPERPRIVAAEYVVGNTENIEAGRSVEVDHAASESSPSVQVVCAWSSQSSGRAPSRIHRQSARGLPPGG